MDAEKFRLELAKLNMSVRRFADYVGSNERTARRWAGGEQDIPPWVDVVCELLKDSTDSRGGAHYTQMRAARRAYFEAFFCWVAKSSPHPALALGEATQTWQELLKIVPADGDSGNG